MVLWWPLWRRVQDGTSPDVLSRCVLGSLLCWARGIMGSFNGVGVFVGFTGVSGSPLIVGSYAPLFVRMAAHAV